MEEKLPSSKYDLKKMSNTNAKQRSQNETESRHKPLQAKSGTLVLENGTSCERHPKSQLNLLVYVVTVV